ncbi:MAG: hypothetical protein EON60_07085 [Alphaproteobacteria bacterium]|nr:MAG: hypothetical protein EON60_07085 [Alphaproteobacteria bacterium]
MRGLSLALGLVVAGMAVLAGTAVAQVNITRVEQLAAAQMDKVELILAQQQRSLANGCDKLRILKAEAVTVWEPVTLQDGKPSSGRWSVRYAVEACGELGLRNVDMQVVNNGNVAIDPLVPGSTLADAKLQHDITNSFELAAKVAMPNCTDKVIVRQTEVSVYPKTPKDRWREIWIGAMCGRDVGQVVDFLPTSSGTSFKMSVPNKTAK